MLPVSAGTALLWPVNQTCFVADAKHQKFTTTHHNEKEAMSYDNGPLIHASFAQAASLAV